MVKLVDLKGEWASMIGRLFIAFGGIERTTHECMKKWMNDPIYNNLKNQRLGLRIDLLIALLPNQDFDSKIKAEFEIYFLKAKKLSEHRNLVAHNPLLLVFFEDDFGMSEAITHVHKEDKYMEFDELKSVVEESERTERKLGTLSVLSEHTPQKTKEILETVERAAERAKRNDDLE